MNMNKEEKLELLQWQEELIRPQVEMAVEVMMSELEYAPPPPDPLHVPLSEKAAREKLKEEMTQLFLSQNPSERILAGFDLIFEHLLEVPNGNIAKEELKQAGDRIADEVLADKDIEEYALSLITDPSQAEAISWGISFETYQTIYHLANLFFEKEEFNEAAMIFEVLNLLDGSCYEAWFGAGLCHYHLERWREAAADFSMAMAADPTNILCYTNLAHCYMKMGEHENAIEMIDKAETLIPASADPSLRKEYSMALDDLRKQAA